MRSFGFRVRTENKKKIMENLLFVYFIVTLFVTLMMMIRIEGSKNVAMLGRKIDVVLPRDYSHKYLLCGSIVWIVMVPGWIVIYLLFYPTYFISYKLIRLLIWMVAVISKFINWYEKIHFPNM